MKTKMNNDDLTRVFFIVTSETTNAELFETREGAMAHYDMIQDDTKIITVSLVKNAYKDDNGQWNYEDLNDTFVQEWIL